MHIDFHNKEIILKLVYYGPALSGKTTNLIRLHERIKPAFRGNMMTIETKDDRTIFFDLLPVEFTSETGVKIRIKLFTVPGQVIHDATRRLVLQSVDGVGFIADSRNGEIAHNAESFRNLSENLRFNGLDIKEMPLVIQFNKRDLPDIRPDDEIDRQTAIGREPVFKAVAVDGAGVVETFAGLLMRTWTIIEARHRMRERFAIDAGKVLRSFESIFEEAQCRR